MTASRRKLGIFFGAVALGVLLASLPVTFTNHFSLAPNKAEAQSFTSLIPGASAFSTLSQAVSSLSSLINGTSSAPVTCSGLGNYFSNVATCFGWSVESSIGSFLAYLASWVLQLAGVLFNWTFTQTILQFGQLVNQNVITGINTAWTAFRDISNIVIIGTFTFIAISTILGIEEFGYKKLLAKVLVVAILINFSLLFTKIIIDISNFTASQVYAAAAQSNPDLQTSETTSADQPAGIAGAFMRYGGLSTLGQTKDAITNIGPVSHGGDRALLYGILVTILYLATAIILFYGSFLLITRAILMVFLMITASVAFATQMLPGKWQGNYGFSAWLSTLFKNALFAPLLMIFLWVTLTIASDFHQAIKGSLGDLITNPQNGSGTTAVLGYLIVIGLLYASLRVSSSFATQIAGFSWAQGALTAPLAALNRFGIAPLLRNAPGFGGRGQAARAQVLEKDIARESRIQAHLKPEERNFAKLTSLMRQKDQAEARAKSTFDVTNTKLGQALGKNLGVPKSLLEKTKTNFADSSKERAEEAAKKAAGTAISRKDAEDVIKKEVEKEHEDRTLELKEQHKTNAKLVEELTKTAEASKESEDLPNKLKSAVERVRNTENEASKNKVDIEEKLARGEIDRTTRNRQIQEQDERIKNAKAAVETIQSRIGVIEKPMKEATDELAKTVKDIDAHEKEKKNQIDKRTNDLVAGGAESAQQFSAELSKSWWRKMVNAKPDEVTAKKARDLTKKKIGTKGIKERVQAEHDILKDAGEGGGGGH